MGRKKGSGKSGKKSFEQQVRDLDEFFVDEVLMMTPEKLGDKLISLTKYRIEMEEQKDNDLDLKKAKEAAQEAGKVYSEAFKAIKLKQKYIFNLLSQQGRIDSVGDEKTVNYETVAKAVEKLKESLGDAELTVTASSGTKQ